MLTVTLGCARENPAKISGIRVSIFSRHNPTRTTPSISGLCRAASAVSFASTIRCAWGIKRSPASESRIAPFARRNTGAPTSCSSFFICMDTAAGDLATRSAACLTEPVSATAMNVLSTSISNRIEPGSKGAFILRIQHF